MASTGKLVYYLDIYIRTLIHEAVSQPTSATVSILAELYAIQTFNIAISDNSVLNSLLTVDACMYLMVKINKLGSSYKLFEALG